MEDNVALALKFTLLVIVVWQLYRNNPGALIIMVIPLFMVGVEIVTDNNDPWAYLFSSDATSKDYYKALFGGMVGIAFLGMIYSLALKDLMHSSLPK